MKKTLTTILVLLFVATTFAQSSDDAYRFSQTFYQGTAKALGMGNALGAVGGDMTAICINPASMGLYRSDEITFSLDLLDNLHHSTYYDETANANKFRLTLPNFGYVNAKQRSNYRKLRFTQFGIGLTRTNDFNLHTYAKGNNPTSSKIDNYLQQIDGLSPSDFPEFFPMDINPAWETFLIDTIGSYYDSPVPQGGIRQSQENAFKGRSEEWTFAGSMNFSERFFIGASLGLQHVKRVGSKVFEEAMPEDENTHLNTDFNQWSYTEEISTRGMGLNVKLGFIYHANRWLRLGASFHSPTLYKFDESWQTETESQINWITRKYISPESHYEYNFISPLKAMGSLAFIIGQRGLVSLDAEYTNYGTARFKEASSDTGDDEIHLYYNSINANIKANYRSTLNFRLGTEWRLQNSYLRLGAGYYGSPYGLEKTDGSTKKIALGIGLPVSEIFTFDFAYELTYGKDQFYLYDAGYLEIKPVTQRQFKSNFAVTLKMRF
jgi:long-subunit fatty acid transport protein